MIKLTPKMLRGLIRESLGTNYPGASLSDPYAARPPSGIERCLNCGHAAWMHDEPGEPVKRDPTPEEAAQGFEYGLDDVWMCRCGMRCKGLRLPMGESRRALAEARPPMTGRGWGGEFHRDAVEYPEKKEGSISKGKEAMEADVQEEIDEMRDSPEFQDLDAFMAFKLDDEEFTYNFIELQALARNVASRRVGRRVEGADKRDLDQVRTTLEGEMGFKYVPRERMKQVRGATSNPNGTSPYAGMGGGGSGFGNNEFRGGGGFTSFGGGPGAIGGGYEWDPNDPKNLGMGAKRRKK